MSKSLLLLNYQSDRLLSAPQFCCWLLTEIGGWTLCFMDHYSSFILILYPAGLTSQNLLAKGKKTRLDCKPTGGYKAPSSGRNCVLQPQNNTEPHQPLRWIQVLYYFSPNVHRYSVFCFVFYYSYLAGRRYLSSIQVKIHFMCFCDTEGHVESTYSQEHHIYTEKQCLQMLKEFI